MQKKLTKQGGFNLIELLVVMAIIAVLIAMVIVAISIARRGSRDTQRRNNMQALKAGLEDYYTRNKTYPPSTGTMGLTSIRNLASCGSTTCACGTNAVCSIADPNGNTDNNRYFYRRGTCPSGTATGKYELRLISEGASSTTPATFGCATTNFENFGLQ